MNAQIKFHKIIIVILFCLVSFLWIYNQIQFNQTYTNEKLGISITYPSNWGSAQESSDQIMFTGISDSVVNIKALENQSLTIDLHQLLQEELINQSQHLRFKKVNYAEVSEITHNGYLIFTTSSLGYFDENPTIGSNPVSVYMAVVQYKNRIAIISVSHFGYVSAKETLEKIIEGFVFLEPK